MSPGARRGLGLVIFAVGFVFVVGCGFGASLQVSVVNSTTGVLHGVHFVSNEQPEQRIDFGEVGPSAVVVRVVSRGFGESSLRFQAVNEEGTALSSDCGHFESGSYAAVVRVGDVSAECEVSIR